MKLKFFKESLEFKKPAGTSRGVLLAKPSWIFFLEKDPSVRGECSIIPGLSPEYDSDEQFEIKIKWVCQLFNSLITKQDEKLVLSYFCVELINFPSILFGIETLFYNWNLKKDVDPFSSKFSQGIEGILINGLIWMGPVDKMLAELESKVNEGYKILKLKIGAIDFKKEVEILKIIRKKFGQNIQIRVDANGAFVEHQIRDVLLQLKEQGVHSIEQPIKTGNWNLMRELCRECTVPIALDEELIGVKSYEEKKNVLESLRPQYIILKPSLHGGIYGCQEWIELAESLKIGWWLTSALESNIGLEMISRLAAFLKPQVAHGLGTGGLFHNNFSSKLLLKEGCLFLRDEKK